MAKTKKQKKQEIENLSTKLAESKATVFGSFDEVSVKDIEELRKELRENEAEMVVIKKTLMKKALKENKLEELNTDEFTGSVAAVMGYNDEVAPARVVSKFKKTHDSVNIFSGTLESNILSIEEINNLAMLPSREELLAKVVGSLKAPVSNLVGVCAGLLRNVVGTLKAVSESKQ